MKKHDTPARSPRKLAIAKDQLRSLPQDQLTDVRGGDGQAPPIPPRPDGIGSWY